MTNDLVCYERFQQSTLSFFLMTAVPSPLTYFRVVDTNYVVLLL